MATNDSTTNDTAGEPERAMDRLLGYTGTIQLSPVDSALDEQRQVLLEAHGVVRLVARTLSDIGEGREKSWRAQADREVLEQAMQALNRVAATIQEVASSIDAGRLEDRGLAIARKGVELQHAGVAQ